MTSGKTIITHKAAKRFALFFVMLCIFVVGLIPAAAQTPAICPATQDDVNRVAGSMYCPVCENIPLDACGTTTCVQWQNEIRVMLEQCMTEAQIVSNFVQRFGDRVVGIPQDPLLRGLSLITPWVLAAFALAVGVYTFVRWSRNRSASNIDMPEIKFKPAAESDAALVDDSYYRAQLEEDLKRRR